MLQIIGWMGCVYLFVKGLEFIANRSYRNDDGSYALAATMGSVVCWLAAIGFFFLLKAQGDATSLLQATPFPSAVIESAPTNLQGAADDAEAAANEADAAAREAEAAIKKGD